MSVAPSCRYLFLHIKSARGCRVRTGLRCEEFPSVCVEDDLLHNFHFYVNYTGKKGNLLVAENGRRIAVTIANQPFCILRCQ